MSPWRANYGPRRRGSRGPGCRHLELPRNEPRFNGYAGQTSFVGFLSLGSLCVGESNIKFFLFVKTPVGGRANGVVPVLAVRQTDQFFEVGNICRFEAVAREGPNDYQTNRDWSGHRADAVWSLGTPPRARPGGRLHRERPSRCRSDQWHRLHVREDADGLPRRIRLRRLWPHHHGHRLHDDRPSGEDRPTRRVTRRAAIVQEGQLRDPLREPRRRR